MEEELMIIKFDYKKNKEFIDRIEDEANRLGMETGFVGLGIK